MVYNLKFLADAPDFATWPPARWSHQVARQKKNLENFQNVWEPKQVHTMDLYHNLMLFLMNGFDTIYKKA